MTHVYELKLTSFIDEDDVDTKSYGIYSNLDKAVKAANSIKLNKKRGEYVEVRLIVLDSPYPESPIVVHTVDSRI